MHILCLYVLFDYVQRCEDTVSVELRYIFLSYFIYPAVWLTVGAPLEILQPASFTPHGSQLSVA